MQAPEHVSVSEAGEYLLFTGLDEAGREAADILHFLQVEKRLFPAGSAKLKRSGFCRVTYDPSSDPDVALAVAQILHEVVGVRRLLAGPERRPVVFVPCRTSSGSSGTEEESDASNKGHYANDSGIIAWGKPPDGQF